MSDVAAVVLLDDSPHVVLLDDSPRVVYAEGMDGAVSADVARENAAITEADRIEVSLAREATVEALDDALEAQAAAEMARDEAEGAAATAGTILDAIEVATGGSTFVGSLTVQAETRAEIKTFSGMSEGKQVYLSERGKIGLWVFRAGSHTAEVTSDPFGGLWLAPASAPTGASGAWERRFDDDLILGSWFAPPQDGTDAGPCLHSMSSAISARGGGTLKLEEGGNFVIGAQASDVVTAEFGTYRFGPVTQFIFEFVGCSSPVVLDLNGAAIRCMDGLKWGNFNVDGTPTATAMPYTGPGASTPYLAMVRYKDCASVTLVNGELDGDLADQVIGGRWGDAGWQIPMIGIRIDNCTGPTRVRGIRSHHHGLDGIVITGADSSELDPDEMVELEDCQFDCNARQGLSAVGGIGIRARRCSFSWTGKVAVNDDTALVANTPGAGIDLEAETGPVRRFYAEDCTFIGNTGPGFLANPSDVLDVKLERCLFIGTTGFSAWLLDPRIQCIDCVFVGAVANGYPSSDVAKATQFRGCKFYAGVARSPSGHLFFQSGNPLMIEFGGSGAQNILFDDCVFDTEGHATAKIGIASGALLRNCTMKQDSTATAFLQNLFFDGRNSITSNGSLDTFNSINRGQLLFNGVPTMVRQLVNSPMLSGYAGLSYQVDMRGLSLGGSAESMLKFFNDYADGGKKSIDWFRADGNLAGQIAVVRDDARNRHYIAIRNAWNDFVGSSYGDIARFSHDGMELLIGALNLAVGALKMADLEVLSAGGGGTALTGAPKINLLADPGTGLMTIGFIDEDGVHINYFTPDSGLYIGGNKVAGPRQGPINNATGSGGAVVDVQARSTIDALLAERRSAGSIAT